jgi:hypothetical protein
MDQPQADFVHIGAHVAHVHTQWDLGHISMTCPFYNTIGESWSDSEGIPWGFHLFQTVGIPRRTPVLLQSHRASWVRLRTIMTWALCLEDMMWLVRHSWTMNVMAPRGHLFKVNSMCLGCCSRPKPHMTYHVTQPLTEVV